MTNLNRPVDTEQLLTDYTNRTSNAREQVVGHLKSQLKKAQKVVAVIEQLLSNDTNPPPPATITSSVAFALQAFRRKLREGASYGFVHWMHCTLFRGHSSHLEFCDDLETAGISEYRNEAELTFAFLLMKCEKIAMTPRLSRQLDRMWEEYDMPRPPNSIPFPGWESLCLDLLVEIDFAYRVMTAVANEE